MYLNDTRESEPSSIDTDLVFCLEIKHEAECIGQIMVRRLGKRVSNDADNRTDGPPDQTPKGFYVERDIMLYIQTRY